MEIPDYNSHFDDAMTQGVEQQIAKLNELAPIEKVPEISPTRPMITVEPGKLDIATSLAEKALISISRHFICYFTCMNQKSIFLVFKDKSTRIHNKSLVVYL